MIDSHCHFEQKDYDSDREDIIKKCKKELRAVISCCAHSKHIHLTLELAKKHPDFIFTCFSLHPEYIKEITLEQINELKDILRKEIKENNNKNIVAIGETGLDFHWVKEPEWREKQAELFEEFIELSKELNLPLVIHSWEAIEECIDILEKNNCKKVLMHLFGGNMILLDRVIANDWYITLGPGIKKSKSYRKIAKKMPINKILLETDAPWWGFGQRNDPTSVKLVCEVIAEEKNLPVEQVERQTDLNAKEFFNLPIKI